jgi:hypothetical protein
MKLNISRYVILVTCFVLVFSADRFARAVDIEAFEFNDAAGTSLATAVNTGTADIGTWAEDADMVPSDIRGGAYNIVKGSSNLDTNFFQINNVTSGTVYLVTRLTSWQFGDTYDSANEEEFRMGFLNDDDVDFGSTITAQFGVRRTGATTAELFGDALGTGSSNIANPVSVPIAQTQPFTAVIELNKTSNSYKVFYKDGTNPTQVLGLGSVAPTRDGNSVRMVANNDWSEFNLDYPVEPPYEVMAVDRVAVADTNPFTDLITLEIDRDNAAMTLRNTSGAALNGIQSYSITSATGALNPAGWNSAGATPTVSTNEELAGTYGAPINVANNGTLTLSMGAGAWLRSPSEDLQMVLNLTGGVTRTVNVNFIDNGGVKFLEGDFSLNNQLDAADWLSFIADMETDLSGLSQVEAYREGDLNGDGENNIADFVEFKALYDDFNGGGAFLQMVQGLSAPEPSSFVLLGTAMLLAGGRRRRGRAGRTTATNTTEQATNDESTSGVNAMRMLKKRVPMLLAAVFVVAAARPAQAVILQDFPFNDPNGTTLDAVANVASPGNPWFLSGNSWDPSVVNNGNFRITKTSTNLANAHLDIANVTTGKVWLVAEVAGWNFAAVPGPGSASEEVRFAFIDNNDASPPTGSTITAQMDIRRSGSGMALVGVGALGTGATNITGQYLLPLVQTNPFTMVLELDKDADEYSVYYKDGAGQFTAIGAPGLLGASTLNPGDRDGNIIRFAPTGSFNDPGEFFDISRIYLTDTSPIGQVGPTALTLEVKSNGQVAIRNDTANAIDFNSYRISFGDDLTEDLNFAGWNSMSDQNLNPVGGGNDPGETWDEAGGADDHALAEAFLLGSTSIAASGPPIQLGSAFRPGGDHEDLTFEYFDMTLQSIISGEIDFVTVAGLDGDYNADGTVNAADYVAWRKLNGTNFDLPNDPNALPIDDDQYLTWRSQFGSSAPGGGGSANVPEPTVGLPILGLAIAAGLRRKRLRLILR